MNNADKNKYEAVLFAAELSDADMPTIDLHGCSVNEATHLLDEFLNKCFFDKQISIKIVTGVGEGKLHHAIQESLADSKLVAVHKSGNSLNNHGGCFYAVLHI